MKITVSVIKADIGSIGGHIQPSERLLAEVERRAIERALRACGGNRTRTAERLGISRRHLFDKIREYDLSD